MRTYDIALLEPYAFEHLAVQVARRVLGNGVRSFSDGPDGGRDAIFEGQTDYPSRAEPWSGVWYIQAKCASQTIGKDPQKWLKQQINKEIKRFQNPQSGRVWPDIWIIVSNVEASGGRKGTEEYARLMLQKHRPQLAERAHFWGPKMLLDVVLSDEALMRRYSDFLTPGHIISRLLDRMGEHPEFEPIVRALTIDSLRQYEAGRLEQAGLKGDAPPLSEIFVDLPFSEKRHRPIHRRHEGVGVCVALARTLAANHRGMGDIEASPRADTSPVWLVYGGPGQGKTTVGQFVSQIHRAAIAHSVQPVSSNSHLISSLKTRAEALNLWPSQPRLPVIVELKAYAKWRSSTDGQGIISYLSDSLRKTSSQQSLTAIHLRLWLPRARWLFVFDGLDEVPQPSKDVVAGDVLAFLDEFRPTCDIATVCTTRPQGYGGQFDTAPGLAFVELVPLTPEEAVECAMPYVEYQVNDEEAVGNVELLRDSAKAEAVRSLMSSPLHAHIIAILIRTGVRPPDRKWSLFSRFYEVVFEREVGKRLAGYEVLAQHPQLIRTVHDRLGFLLHALSERSENAAASLTREAFRALVVDTVTRKVDVGATEIGTAIAHALRERLVLISTPDSGDSVRFDIRQLQEFFAAAFLVTGRRTSLIYSRVSALIMDSHWREPMLFLISAFAIGDERDALLSAISAVRSVSYAEDVQRSSFLRAMAVGPHLALQLAQDGALEIDKTIRGEFREQFVELFRDDIPMVIAFEQIRGRQTAAWVVLRAIEQIKESTFSTLGAARALISLMSDDHPGADVVSDLLMAHSKRIRLGALMLDAAMSHPLREWHVMLIVRLIYASRSSVEVSDLAVLFSENFGPFNKDLCSRVTTALRDNERVAFVYLYGHDRDGLVPIAVRDCEESAFVHMMWCAVSFAKEPAGPSLKRLNDCFEGGLASPPPALRDIVPAYFFFTVDPHCADSLYTLSHSDYIDFVKRAQRGEEPLWGTAKTFVGFGVWLAEVQTLRPPSIGVRAWVWCAGLRAWLGGELEGVDKLVAQHVDKMPELASSIPPSLWGHLLAVSADRVRLLSLLLNSNAAHEGEHFPKGIEAAFVPFEVPDSDVSAALRMVVQSAAVSSLGGGWSRGPDRKLSFGEMMHACFRRAPLEAVMSDAAMPPVQRAMALIALAGMVEDAVSAERLVRSNIDILFALDASDERSAIAVGVLWTELKVERHDYAQRFVGRTLAVIRPELMHCWIALFSKWRERGQASFSSMGGSEQSWFIENCS